MVFYQIRLKLHPDYYISKNNTAYAFTSDQELAGSNLQLDAHWFCDRKYAKTWSTLTPIKRRRTYNRIGNHTFSQYELVIIENGLETIIPLDAI